MHILAIDVGTYSVKYLSSFVDRRKINHVDMSEITLRDYREGHEDLTTLEAQAGIVQEIIDSNARPDTRIIFQSDIEMMTTRFITLPVKNKKKAELMLPFQLEEDIPYALSEIHYAYRMEAMKGQHMAIVELARTPSFEQYFQLYKEKNALPNILTTEASIIENFFCQLPMSGPFCILDMGHKTTKAYFFNNTRLLMTHVSYVGGVHVNEMIAETYQIDPDEAIMYKHQNAFMLTPGQYETVEPSQRDFAFAMDRVFLPLVSDFMRWKIGLKVNFGLSLGNIYLCGGTSCIKNIANYLTDKWETKVSLLETFDRVETEKIDLNPKNKSKYALANMMATGFKKKNRFINLLSGQFIQTSSAELPLHSLAFIGVRVATVAALLAITLLIEQIFIKQDIQYVNSRITTLLKNDELRVKGRDIRAVAKDPRPVSETLKKNQKTIKQEIATLQSAIEIQALPPLVALSQVSAKFPGTLVSFFSNDMGEMKAIFTVDTVEELKRLSAGLKGAMTEANVTEDEAGLQVKISAGN